MNPSIPEPAAKASSSELNRRQFCRKSFLLFGSLPLAAALSSLKADPKAGPASPNAGAASPPVLQNPGGNGEVTVVWAVSGLCTGRVEYGETAALGQSAHGSVDGLMPLDDKVLKIRLTGLKPGTKYFYRIVTCPIDFVNAYKILRGAETAGDIHSFRTLDPKAASTTFAVINDTHETKETMTRLAGLVAANSPDMLVWNGDMVNSIPSEQTIIDNILNPAGLSYAVGTPLVLTKGNHDQRGAKARLLDRCCDTPDGKWYYFLRQGPVAFLVLDTGEDKADSTPVYAGLNDFDRYRTVQQEWLRAAIERPEFRDAPFRVVLCHIPMLWSSYRDPLKYCSDGKKKWHDLFVQGRVDLVISGHTHKFAWFPPGLQAPYAQLVGGGPKPLPSTQSQAATFIRGRADQQNLSFTMCDLDEKELASYTFQRRA